MKAVIIGAGIAGLTLANRLSSLGSEVTVVEHASRPRTQGYMIDFYGPGYDAVKAMGMLPAIQAVNYDLDGAGLIDASGRTRAQVEPRQFADGPLLNLMRPDLERVLREHLPHGVDTRYGTGPTAISHAGDSVRVSLDNGETLTADVLVGADGIHSTVRRLAFGPEEQYFRYMGYHTMAYTFDASDVHAATAGRASMTDSLERQMGFYGLRDGRVAAFGVCRSPRQPLPGDIRAAVRDRFAGLGWITPQALKQCPPAEEIYYDQVAQVHLPTWRAGRVVLLGDAAYAVSLFAGLGSSLATAGAYLLADRLARASSVQAGLEAYEQLWRPVATDKQKIGRSAADWFLPTTPTQLRTRRAALRTAKLPIVSRILPSLLAGKPVRLITELAAAGDPPALTGGR